MKKSKAILVVSLYGLLGGVLAYVYDVDYVDPAKHYALEKSVYDNSHPLDGNPFPSFGEWMSQNEGREQALVQEFGYQCAETFDPWFERP